MYGGMDVAMPLPQKMKQIIIILINISTIALKCLLIILKFMIKC